jgi:hypothetical protein
MDSNQKHALFQQQHLLQQATVQPRTVWGTSAVAATYNSSSSSSNTVKDSVDRQES